MFQKNLSDLVKGIRNNKKNEEQYILQQIEEIKSEIKSTDLSRKTTALQKLTYLHMLGYDMSWAAFHVIEVMSSPRFDLRRIAYLAASQSFDENTDVLLLATQNFKKTLSSGDMYEVGMALNALSNIINTDLARDLASDVVVLLRTGKPYVRRRATLLMYKVFVKYPDALRPSFPNIREKLEDNDPGTVSASVNVVCELARRNPKNYLGLAPLLYRLLTTTNENNWMKIKIVKLFASLTPIEPRLGKKLVEPMTSIINSTPAKSLLYECLNTVTTGMLDHVSVVRLAVDKLKTFVMDPDQNLKYLGLLGLNNVLKRYPKIIADLKEVILDCMKSDDITIRYRAVDLLAGVISKKNIKDIVKKLMRHAMSNEGPYRDYIIEKILESCKYDNYKHISNFQWYISTLVQISDLPSLPHGQEIASQLMDVVIRVQGIRPFGVKRMISLLNSSNLINENFDISNMHQVLYAAAWLVGEFVKHLDDPQEAIPSLLQPRAVYLPGTVQSTYIQSVLKVYAALAKPESSGSDDLVDTDNKDDFMNNISGGSQDSSKLQKTRNTIREGLDPFIKSFDVEVQERAATALKILDLHEELLELGTDIGPEINGLFDEELNPVKANTQRKVPKPQELDLDEWIYEPYDNDDTESLGSDLSFSYADGADVISPVESYQNADYHQNYLERKKSDIYYLSGSANGSPTHRGSKPSKKSRKDRKKDRKKGKKGQKKKSKKKQPIEAEPQPESDVPMEVSAVEDAPEGALPDSDEEKKEEEFDELGNVDLRAPLKEEEKLPTLQEYKRETAESVAEKINAEKRKERKQKRKAKKKATNEVKEPSKKGKKKRDKKSKKENQEDQLLDLMDENQDKSSKDKNATASNSKKSSSSKKRRSKKDEATIKPKKVCSDDNVTVACDLQSAKAAAAREIELPFVFRNSGSKKITSVSIDVKDSISTKMMRQDQGPVTHKVKIAPNNSSNVAIRLKVNNITQEQKITGTLKYSMGKNFTSDNIKFRVSLPCYIFMTPAKISSEQITEHISSGSLSFSSSGQIDFKTTKSFEQAANIMASLLRLRLIEVIENTATMYGRSVQDHHVFVLCKNVSKMQMSMDIRSSSDTLASSLVTEATQYFKRH
eukprot:gb/GECH01012819.1/.p1 GENE.gb/GECH01012819.1/~~gb/GECH01012819.1/.p1  ORF type:complete len:1117 (+),score=330.82 gb/GECH01012819.1/:1-3351(+)